jgi:hypothetical protein
LDDFFDTCQETLRQKPCSLIISLLDTLQLESRDRRHLQMNLILPLQNVWSKHVTDNRAPTITELQDHFVPYAASSTSYSDNAKVSVVLESLLGGIIRDTQAGETIKVICNPDAAVHAEMLREESAALREAISSGSLMKAIKEGSKARKKKATGDARKKSKGTEGEEQSARIILDESCLRLELMVKFLMFSKYPDCFPW